MRFLDRRALLGMAVAAAMAVPIPVQARDVTMNLGWATPLDSDYGILASKFAELAQKYSNGTVTVRQRCCGQIASEDDAFKALQLGTVDGYLISQNNVSPSWPLMDVLVLPYIFQSPEHLVKVSEGPVGQAIKDRLLKDTKVHLLTFGGPSYRDFYNTVRPINTLKDMSDLKVRVPKNAVMIKTFEAFGTKPVPLAWSDTPTALQTGTIDGADNGTSVIQEMKFYEFAKHLTVMDAFAGFSPLFASDRFMGRLDADQKAAVLRAAKEAGEFHTVATGKATEEVRTWLVNTGGMQMTRPDLKAFIAAGLTVQKQVAAERGPDFVALVDQIRAAAE